MGVVYRIKFADGSFYIGATNNIERRISEHYKRPCPLIADKINFFKLTAYSFEMSFEVIETDSSDYFMAEKRHIWENRDDFFFLNTSIPIVNPFLPEDQYLREVRLIKSSSKSHIVVREATKNKFDRLKDSKGMTQDGLVNYLMKQDKLRYDDQK